MLNKSELSERAIEALEEFHGVEELDDEQMAGAMSICDEVWEYIINELNLDDAPTEKDEADLYDS